MSLCQHDDCEREGIAAWNGCVFCDEHVRERLRTTADSKLLARIFALESALTVAADLRESDIDGTDEFTFHWRSLLFGCSPSSSDNLSPGSALSDAAKPSQGSHD